MKKLKNNFPKITIVIATYNSEKTIKDCLESCLRQDYRNKEIDSEQAFKLISKKGVIIWHNYDDVTNPEVTKYLADLSKTRKLFHLRNTMLVIYIND